MATCLRLFLQILFINLVLADSNKFFNISSLCSQNILAIKIDGAVILSKSEINVNCKITFKTDTIRHKFMLRFTKLSLDCNDHLLIYDGEHIFTNYKTDLSCRDTIATIGLIFTKSNYLTIEYKTDSFNKLDDNGFKLIITAYKENAIICKDFKCSNTFCISNDLQCDNIDHCGDNSDEINCQVSSTQQMPFDWFGFDPIIIITFVLIVFILSLTCVILICFYLCRRQQELLIQQGIIKQSLTAPSLTHQQLQQYHSIVDKTKFNTLPQIREKPSIGVPMAISSSNQLYSNSENLLPPDFGLIIYTTK